MIFPFINDFPSYKAPFFTTNEVQKEVLPYSMVRYPSEAPSSIEILPWLIGWFGCLTDVTWETLGGAQLRFHDGELVFYPGDGHGNKDDPIWRSGTKHIGKELCFAEDGDNGDMGTCHG